MFRSDIESHFQYWYAGNTSTHGLLVKQHTSTPAARHAAIDIGRWAGVATALLVALAAAPNTALGQQIYWDTESLLVDFFPDAERVTYARATLDSGALGRLESLLGYRPVRAAWTVFIAIQDGQVAGYAVIDEEPGQHEAITFAVRLSPDAVIDRVEVMVYREHYGDEVRDERFRRQFIGRTSQDPMRVGREIVAISGATISSRSLALGARRASAIVAELIEQNGDAIGSAIGGVSPPPA